MDGNVKQVVHRITSTLLALFEVYDVDPELIEVMAEELSAISRDFTAPQKLPVGARGKLAMERLLDELETPQGE